MDKPTNKDNCRRFTDFNELGEAVKYAHSQKKGCPMEITDHQTGLTAFYPGQGLNPKPQRKRIRSGRN